MEEAIGHGQHGVKMHQDGFDGHQDEEDDAELIVDEPVDAGLR